MPERERSRPRYATVEDWDEENDTILAGSRSTAHPSTRRSDVDTIPDRRQETSYKDPGDSGYSSRADTLVSEASSSRRKTNDFNLEQTAFPIERERQPYHVRHDSTSKPVTQRQSAPKTSDSVPKSRSERSSNKARYVHYQGVCTVCDRYGWHDESKIETLRTSTMPPNQPPSPKVSRKPIVKNPIEEKPTMPKSKRSASMRQAKPLNVLTEFAAPPPHFQQPVYTQSPVFAASGWPSQPFPPVQYTPLQYSYAPPPTLPAGIQFAPYQTTTPFVDHTTPEPRSARPSRRSSPVRRTSTYGDPVIRYEQDDDEFIPLSRVQSRDQRPPPSNRLSQNFDIDRFNMPPPPKPQPADVVLTRRPSNRRAQTYHPEETLSRGRLAPEPSHHEEFENDLPDLRHTVPRHMRKESPSRPPNSYKAPVNLETRPALPKKSVTYSTPESVSKVASSRKPASRRTTLPSIPMEQKEAEAEAYQQKRNSINPHLTAEALKNLDKGTSSSRSETGSSYSHKSHQSSKDSSRGRSHTSSSATHLTLPGGLNFTIPANYGANGPPLSIIIGSTTVSVGGAPPPIEKPREQRRIERAPSVTSKTSRRSIASSSNSANDPPKKTVRRPSQLDESARPSRQHSRTPSTNQPISEYSYTTRRQSVDLSNKFEGLHFGA